MKMTIEGGITVNTTGIVKKKNSQNSKFYRGSAPIFTDFIEQHLLVFP